MTESFVNSIEILPIRYQSDRFDDSKIREIDEYFLSGVYDSAGVSYRITEPRYKEDDNDDIETRLGKLNREIAVCALEGLNRGSVILMCGGNCSHTLGIVGALQRYYGDENKIGLVWLDAHGDFNTPDISISGMYGGMPLAAIAGMGLEEWRNLSWIDSPLEHSNIILADGRNLDEKEEELLRSTDIVYLDKERFNNTDTWKEAVSELSKRVDVIYLHIDADILDGRYMPNHKMIEQNGPSVEYINKICEEVLLTSKVAAFSLVSVYFDGDKEKQKVNTQSGKELLEHILRNWKAYPKKSI